MADQTVDLDGVRLSDAVAARLCLQVVLRVPIRVEDNHRVGGDQVDPEPAGPAHARPI